MESRSKAKHQNGGVADVLRKLNLSARNFTVHQEKTLRALSYCRTSALGGHIDACDGCGNLSISYNSCRNRHCPQCQGHKKEEWIRKREADLLPCSYYHLVFTLPEELNGLSIANPTLVYKTLFEAAWATLNQFGKTEGMQLGMIAILHTWGQNLSLHPHLHCIVPGGGINRQGRWKKKVRNDKYLFSVKAMSKVFRAKFVASLKACGIKDADLMDRLFAKKWVVYAKRPFGGPKQVIEYLGRYTHKVAISNHRIKEVTDKEVRFGYKDYRKGGEKKEMTLSHVEFIRRFSLHILPRRFVRIRHYGILSSSWKRGKLQSLQSDLNIRVPEAKPKTLLNKCRCCKEGNLVTIAIFGQRGPPQDFLFVTQPLSAK
ncbi:IS91 family transposase [Epilithonimonas vandammei]|uniref:IS91 family transposase n=2 Tax=Epilithonimonas vandammei TaxID=2487072 RepID=A0A3G8Y5W3_9FLAO|nr:IS91 family transposase [Epilithonimonas vandammei]AZI39724.1 IS91 family transposase [Epilithonimonas vandammei]AZI39935.1 IS91 family transposase [Epilithonimonas vandammei]AZI40738.1 IS91 family transposase [Epilithonimonas vandammei]